ncbi:Xanthomonalisin [Thermoflexales bacterium]|nr:Xanthomonalisin [Thermoflexales bacterium]
MRKSVVLFAVLLSLIALAVVVFQPGPAGSTALIPRQSGPQPIGAVGTPVVDPVEIDVPGELVVGDPVVPDVSPPLRDIPVPQIRAVPDSEVREMGVPGETESGVGPADDRAQGVDPVVQSEFGSAERDSARIEAPSPSVNFDGLTNIDGVYPPDTNGEVGPNHYVQWVNLHFQIFNKSGVSVYGPAAGNAIWSGFGGPCETRNDGDPIVLYDQLADRWVMTQFTAANPYGECVAISTTGDPTGSYYRYFFQFSTSIFYDYPKLGVWTDGYYLSDNRFGTVSFQGASAIALERDKMLLGQAARYVEFKTSTSYGTLLPADLDGSTLPPTGSPAFFAEIGSTALRLWKFKVDWANTANSTFTGPTNMTVAAYNQLCSSTRSCIPQPGTTVKVDGIGDRLMHRLAYRNFGTHESLVVSHNVNAASSGTKAGVRWYEVRNPNGTPTIYQQGTYSPDSDHRWMGSLAMDRDGNIALGYSVSSASTYPSIRYTGRLASDPLGTLPQGETNAITGSGSQTGSGSRWGDYSAMSVDPVDDCTFWYTTEYFATTGTAPWRTRIVAFKFPSCGSTGPTPTFTPTPTPTSIGPSPTFTPTPTPSRTPTPTYTATPFGNVLQNGVPVTNLSGSQGSQTNFTMNVPAGASNLSFVISGGTGDADLYVRFGAAPTTGTYDCRPYLNGNNETCSFASPQVGTYYVMLVAYTSYSGVSLVGSYQVTGPTNTPTPTPTPTATGTCPNASGGYCRTDNEARTWIAGTTNQSITGDDTTKSVTLPFNFTFAGTAYSSVKISSNGNIHFGTASNAYNNVAIPNTGNPNALIAALWDDLTPNTGGAIYTAVSGTAPNRTFVVEWRGVPRYNAGTNGATFEIQLTETTNQIWIVYQDTDFGNASYNAGASATSGVENAAGSAGNSYSYNQAVLTANKVLHFWPQ